MAKLKKAPLYDLTVHSPCTNCTLTWLPNEWRISTFLIRSKKIKDYKVELEDSSGNKLEMNFYPSPTCFCELSKKYKSDFDFDLSVISPITQLDELAADNGVYLFNSIIEGRGLFSYPLFVSGYGCDMDKELATLKSKMEALERMCFYLYPRSAFRFISLSGFKKIPYWKNTSTLVEKKGQFFYTAYQINGENEMFIPASLVLPKNQVSPIFDLVVNNSSSKGMSVHFSKEAALENGLIEFIESIGNSILWSEGPRLLVDLDSLPSSSQSWIQLI